MYSSKILNQMFHESLSIISYKGGYDTFAFRQVFQTLSTQEKMEIYSYLEAAVSKNSYIYRKVKDQIDRTEFLSSDYYANSFPRQFRGAYYPVVLQTLGGIMRVSI